MNRVRVHLLQPLLLLLGITLALFSYPTAAQVPPNAEPQLHLPIISSFDPQVNSEQDSAIAPPLFLPFVNRSTAPELPPDELPRPFAAGAVLVRYRPMIAAAELDAARAAAYQSVQALTVEPLSPLAPDAEKITLAPSVTVDQAVATLADNPDVLYAEPDYLIRPAEAANDPYYKSGLLWGMYGDALTPKNRFGSQANEAWAKGFVGSYDTYVGLVDGGALAHDDLAGNLWVNPYDPVDSVDNDGNGYVDDVRGWDFYSDDNTFDDNSDAGLHATHVAGTIGAAGGNGMGVVGVNWKVTIINTRFLGPDGGSTSDAIRALDYLTDLKQRHGLKLVATNNSWTGFESQSLLDAINRGGDAGILFVAAAGNGGSDSSGDNNDSTPVFPAGYQCTNGGTRGWDCVIAVTSINSAGARSGFANYGAASVDLGAPGTGIWSTEKPGVFIPGSHISVPPTYGKRSGTSMAAAHVTGAAALCASSGGGLVGRQLKQAILSSAAPTAALANGTVSGGRLDIGALMTLCQPLALAAPQNLAATAQSPYAILLTWEDRATGETGYTVERGFGLAGPYEPIATLAANATSYTDDELIFVGSTTYYYRVRAFNDTGASEYALAHATAPAAIKVQSVSLALTKTRQGVIATATVVIVNGADQPVGLATVSGEFAKGGTLYSTRSGVTGAAGNALLIAPAIPASVGSVIRFCVTNVTKPSYGYVPGATVCAEKATP